MKKLLRFLKEEEGIEVLEWGIMAALFALAMGVAITYLAGGVSTFFNTIADNFSGASVPTP